MNASKQSQTLRQQFSIKQRDLKSSALVLQQIQGEPHMYKAVGKMFIKEDAEQVRNELESKIKITDKDLAAIETMLKKADEEQKDAERNLKSLIQKVTGKV